MTDRRQNIIDAGLGVLREHGYPGFTQPRVAAAAGLRQSHLTYYFPTRVDLLAAVARAAIDGQLGAIDKMLEAPSREITAGTIASVAARHANTRVMMALAQAADQEPALRELFRELADGITARAGRLFEGLGIVPTPEARFMLHALSVGLAVVDLAVGRPNGEGRARDAIEAMLTLLPRKEERA